MAARVRLRRRFLADILKDIIEGMMARAECKRSRHDAPGTERKDQAQGRGTEIKSSWGDGKECPEGKRGISGADPRQHPEGNPVFLDPWRVGE